MKKKLISFILVLGVICSSCLTYNLVQAKAIKLNKTKAVLEIDDHISLKVKGTKQKAKWKSSNRDVAVVSKNGKVTALDEGKAIITAIIGDTKFKCRITVESDEEDNDDDTADSNNATVSSIRSTTPTPSPTPFQPPEPTPVSTPTPATPAYATTQPFTPPPIHTWN